MLTVVAKRATVVNDVTQRFELTYGRAVAGIVSAASVGAWQLPNSHTILPGLVR
jgi:hypothetical protein